MKIFDCFMYFDEEIILDLRLNILDKHVDYFVIVESIFTHKGEKRDLNFNLKKFEKFKHKIIYLVYEEEPKNVHEIFDNESENEKSTKYIMNAIYRENGQRNFILNGLKDAEDEDMILISDVDEIPNLEKLKLHEIKNKIILFQQDMFYYKLNLKLPNFIWTGTKACKKKYLKAPQWLRNVKDKKFSFFRLDILFSKTKYVDIKFIKSGGWHFTNIKSAEEIKHKFESYLHHREFEINPLSIEEIKKIMKNKKAIYDLRIDKRLRKIGNGETLEKYPIEKLPKFLQDNLDNFEKWMD